MTVQVSEVTKIRRRVLTETARLHWQGMLAKKIDGLPEKMTSEHEQRYRCCEFKEKAIYAQRIKLAMGYSLTPEVEKKRLSSLAKNLSQEKKLNHKKQVEVIDIACDNCPIDRFFITNACRNCLGHHCQESCRKNAIQIVGNQAYIDQSRCVECGLCLKACKYGAIIEVHRPCESACSVGAIKADQNRKAVIEESACVNCGLCVVSCPFGAISDRSQLLQVIDWLKSDLPVIALVAPAIVGQMGLKDVLHPAFSGLRALGFDQVKEVALGADMVALEESSELLQRRQDGEAYMLSSCCPAFVDLVKQHRPHQRGALSSLVSPMVALAQWVKTSTPEAKLVFIGPCIAKKSEALESGVVDAVLTFEELAALFVAAEINIATLEGEEDETSEASRRGHGFAAAGGLLQAMESALIEETELFEGKNAQGIPACLEALEALDKGKATFDFLEGMACDGGCLGGPGALVQAKKTKRLLEAREQKLAMDQSSHNPQAVSASKALGHVLHRQYRRSMDDKETIT